MSDCGCHHEAKNAQERKILMIALALNATMAVVGGIAGWIGQSTGLLADALDMLSDATAYAIGLVAIGRTASFKANAATLSGIALLLLGLGVLFEVGRRVVYRRAADHGRGHGDLVRRARPSSSVAGCSRRTSVGSAGG